GLIEARNPEPRALQRRESPRLLRRGLIEARCKDEGGSCRNRHLRGYYAAASLKPVWQGWRPMPALRPSPRLLRRGLIEATLTLEITHDGTHISAATTPRPH